MRVIFSIVLVLFITTGVTGQQISDKGIIGGPCEGCEALLEYNSVLTNSDTLPAFSESDKQILITGTVYAPDGVKKAKGVIIYIYHTNADGIYVGRPNARGWERRHGSLRGWVQTRKDGRFSFYTSRPGAYPGRSEPEHIHLTIQEPGKNPYYIEDITFSDDPLIDEDDTSHTQCRAGCGHITPFIENGMTVIERDIILGQNIPGHY